MSRHRRKYFLWFSHRWHCVGSLIDVTFKVAFFDSSIWQDHFSMTMLYSVPPLSNIFSTISPAHLTWAMSLILEIFTLIYVTTRPDKYTESMFLISSIFSFILIYVVNLSCWFPPPSTMFEPVSEFTYIYWAVCPWVLTFAVRFAFFKFSLVAIFIPENVCSVTMF